MSRLGKGVDLALVRVLPNPRLQRTDVPPEKWTRG
jgi:hypothetical protein